MKFNQADINSIIEASKNDNLVVFVGAGVSKFSEIGTIKFPNWEQLINNLQEELQTNENDYPKVAQLYYLQFGEYRLYEKLKKLIPLHAKPSEIHEKIFALNPSLVITTNWDNLLESTYRSKGMIYDCIKSDSDLVKSTLPRKVIKIHGDLDTHNIVFKEDDYLNFSLSSPLIENFLRNILSTKTVIFLGYSYNDYNLKIISKWIERQSKISPPRFLLSIRKNSIEELYLSNHGIKVINPLEDEKYDYKEVYSKFLDTIISEENISNKLGSILGKDFDTLKKEEYLYIMNYIYMKLIHLSEFKALLPEQITSVLTDSRLEYHINCFGLRFYSHNRNSSNIYNFMFMIIEQLKIKFEILEYSEIKDKVVFVLRIFLMANCNYIQKGDSDDWIDITSYLSDIDCNNKEEVTCEDRFNSFIRFSYKHIDTYLLDISLLDNINISTNKYEEIVNNFNNKLNSSLENKEYYKAVINMLNIDLVNTYLYRMQSSITGKNNKDAILLLEKTEWESKIPYYPTEIKKYVQPLQDFLNFKTIYKFHSESIVDSDKIIKLENIILNGGFGFTSSYYKSNDMCIQILNFCVNNEIMIDNYSEFRFLMQSYVKSKFEIQIIKGRIEVEEHDLFILIKYFDGKDLRYLLTQSFLKKESIKESLKLVFNSSEKEYLNEVLNNLLKLNEEIDDVFNQTTISKSLSNLIMVLSLVDWSEDEYTIIVDNLTKYLLNNKVPYDLYKSIDYHILLNNNLYHNKYDSVSSLLDVPLYKIISREGSGFYESLAFKSEFNSIIYYMKDNNIQYSNEILVDKVLFHINLIKDNRQKRIVCNDMILKYIFVSNDKIVTKIKLFLNTIRNNDWNNNQYQEIFLELLFNIFDCEINIDFVNFLNNWVDNHYSLDVISDGNFINCGGTQELLKRLNELYKVKDLSVFGTIHHKLREKEIKIRKENNLEVRK
ncbi:SIR2 family protein [uncultured Psychrobacter sp.]|uniref:SIR2 family protein n=1 Tax=uncultured Psychrobacter sp. TaxID=259303 RepID=UPI0026082F2D|nr:SIR2 family protein [uncultured Psychrobacter sp.]